MNIDDIKLFDIRDQIDNLIEAAHKKAAVQAAKSEILRINSNTPSELSHKLSKEIDSLISDVAEKENQLVKSFSNMQLRIKELESKLLK